MQLKSPDGTGKKRKKERKGYYFKGPWTWYGEGNGEKVTGKSKETKIKENCNVI